MKLIIFLKKIIFDIRLQTSSSQNMSSYFSRALVPLASVHFYAAEKDTEGKWSIVGHIDYLNIVHFNTDKYKLHLVTMHCTMHACALPGFPGVCHHAFITVYQSKLVK